MCFRTKLLFFNMVVNVSSVFNFWTGFLTNLDVGQGGNEIMVKILAFKQIGRKTTPLYQCNSFMVHILHHLPNRIIITAKRNINKYIAKQLK